MSQSHKKSADGKQGKLCMSQWGSNTWAKHRPNVDWPCAKLVHKEDKLSCIQTQVLMIKKVGGYVQGMVTLPPTVHHSSAQNLK